MTLAPLKAGIRTHYGEARSTGTVATTNTQRYIDAYQETASLYKLGARYYATTTGRFTQFDPAGQEANPYSYPGCNPVNAKDPTGLSACSYTTAVFDGAAVTGVLAAGAFISSPTVIGGVSLGTLAGGAGAFTGLIGGIAYVECQLEL